MKILKVMAMGTDMAEQNRRIVDIHEYLPVLIDIINTGKDVNLIVTGSSMAPFLCHQRDTIIISKPNGKFFKGQMVFYIRDNGQYVMHRIHHIKNDEFYIVGDNQIDIEGPVRIRCLVLLIRLLEKGKYYRRETSGGNSLNISG